MQGLGVVGAKPGDGACGAVAEVARGCDGAETFALRSAEDAVEDFALDKMAEERDVLGSIEKIDQSGAGVEQADGGFANRDSAVLNGGCRLGKFFAAEHLAHSGHVETQNHESIGTCSEASMIWLSAGTSMEESRKDDSSQRYTMPLRLTRFRPWTKTVRLGS